MCILKKKSMALIVTGESLKEFRYVYGQQNI